MNNHLGKVGSQNVLLTGRTLNHSPLSCLLLHYKQTCFHLHLVVILVCELKAKRW